MSRRAGVLAREGLDWIDEYVALSRSGRKWLNYIFPDHWSFLFGEIALYSFVWLVISGTFLALYYVPSMHTTVYHGSYVALDGQHMTNAYESALNLSLNVRFGLLMRQSHHWAALIFTASIVVHMARIFFTGAFRRPRVLNFQVGATLLLLAIFNGYFGYSMPGDLLSGTGLRIGYSIIESIPFVGSQVDFLLFGGQYPGTILLQRFFFLHVFIFPAIITALIVIHLSMIVRQHHTQFSDKGAREDNVVGTPMWPAYAAKSIGYMCLIFGLFCLLGAIFQIDPIWQYGPYDAYKVSYAAQPDWYLGWIEGAMRLYPNWETHVPGHMIPEVFWSAVFMPAVTWLFLYAYPTLEARLTGDNAHHNILDRPRHRPVRTAFGCAVFTFYAALTVAAGDDVLANWLHVPLEDVVWYMRVGAYALPAIVFLVAYRICIELERPSSASIVDHDLVLTRRPDGSYLEVRQVELVQGEKDESPWQLDPS